MLVLLWLGVPILTFRFAVYLMLFWNGFRAPVFNHPDALLFIQELATSKLNFVVQNFDPLPPDFNSEFQNVDPLTNQIVLRAGNKLYTCTVMHQCKMWLNKEIQ